MAPQLGLHGGGVGEGVDDHHLVGRVPPLPVVLPAVGGVAVGVARSRLVQDVEEPARPFPGPVGIGEVDVPIPVLALDVAGLAPAGPVVHGGRHLAGRFGVDLVQPPGALDGPGKGGVRGRQLNARLHRGQPVTEAAVDRSLRRGEHGHRLAPAVGLVEQGAHEGGEQAPPAMGAPHRHPGHPGHGQGPGPREGEVEPVGVGRGHHLVALEHGQRAVEVHGLAPQLQVGLGGLDAEGGLEAEREGGVLLGGDGAGREFHGPGVPPRRGAALAQYPADPR